MSLTVRSKLFLAAFAVGAVSAVTAAVLLNSRLQRLTVERIEQTLAAETRMAAELLHQNSALPVNELDDEADRLGALVGVRVTFIAPDGKVIGDSTRDGPALAAMENHSQRPEIAEASRRHSEVLIRRYSTTTEYDTLYAAIPITHPAVAFVRLSLPLTEIAQQQRAILLLALGGVGTALPVAALLAWLLSAPLARRVTAIAEVARRYASGDMTRPTRGYGDDELGEVARALDGAIQELGRRVNELAHDRRHLRAILAGMVEGVIVIDAQGRLVMANCRVVEPVDVWMVHLGGPGRSRPRCEGRSPSGGSGLEFVERKSGVDVRFDYGSIRRAKRIRGSPVLVRRLAEGRGRTGRPPSTSPSPRHWNRCPGPRRSILEDLSGRSRAPRRRNVRSRG